MRWIIAAILMVLVSTAVLADVSHFPAPLVEENEFDGYIVVTDENGGLDYLATTKLMNRLFPRDDGGRAAGRQGVQT
jgi:hypothetical protein